MFYRRSPFRFRRYSQWDYRPTPTEALPPLPGREEMSAQGMPQNDNSIYNDDKRAHHEGQPSIRIMGRQIFFDEIILLGLLFLFIDDGIQDELMVLIIIVLLFFGREE